MQDVINKMKGKSPGIILNAPAAIELEFVHHGFKTSFGVEGKSTNTVVFVNDNREYLDFLSNGMEHVEPDSVLWFAYPKGTSKIKTDINRDTLRVTGEEFGITTVTAISIDETWSALRFRPLDRVGK